MTYPKDVSFEYYRVISTCRKVKGRPKAEDMHRYRPNTHPWPAPPHSKGGMVVCCLWKDGEVFAEGYSLCSMADNFNYRVGREIAYGRALAKASRKLSKGKEGGEGSIGKVAYQRVNMAQLPEGRYELDGYCIRLEQRAGGYTLYPEVRTGTETRL